MVRLLFIMLEIFGCVKWRKKNNIEEEREKKKKIEKER